jgi:hypothetical protein
MIHDISAPPGKSITAFFKRLIMKSWCVDDNMKQLDDIYKDIRECLAGKGMHGNNNNVNYEKDKDKNTVSYMFLNPRPTIEEVVAMTDTARQVDE